MTKTKGKSTRCPSCKFDRILSNLICDRCLKYFDVVKGKIVRKLPSPGRIRLEVENCYSDTKTLPKESGMRVTNKNIRECLREHIGDLFFSESWSDAQYKEFDKIVNDVLKECFP